MASLQVVTESELEEMLRPIAILTNASDDQLLMPVRMIHNDRLKQVSTMDLVCSCFYVFFIVSGLSANCWVLRLVISVLRSPECKSTISVPIYVFALTMVNILVILALPFTVSDMLTGQWWPKFGAFCTGYWLLELMNKTMASFILTLLSVSCYFAVCRPRAYRMYKDPRIAVLLIIVGFVIMFAKAVPLYKSSGIFYLIQTLNNATLIVNYGVRCVFQPEDESEQYNFTLCCFLCGYAGPVLIMIFCYGAILRRVASKKFEWTSNNHGSSLNHGRSGRFWKVAKSSAILVAFYLASWTPYWVVLLVIMHKTDPASDEILSHVALVLHVLPYVNCAGSPLLYTLLNKQMRNAYDENRRRQRDSRKRLKSISIMTTNGNKHLITDDTHSNCDDANLAVQPRKRAASSFV